MDRRGGRASGGRVGAAVWVVVAVLAVVGGVFAGVDEVLAEGSSRADWATMAIAVLLLVLVAVSRRLSRRW